MPRLRGGNYREHFGVRGMVAALFATMRNILRAAFVVTTLATSTLALADTPPAKPTPTTKAKPAPAPVTKPTDTAKPTPPTTTKPTDTTKKPVAKPTAPKASTY